MKILVVTDTYYPQTNGVVRYLLQSLPKLAKQHEIVLFAPESTKSDEIVNTQWIKSIPFPLYEGYRIALPDLFLLKKIKDEKPDIIHCHAPVNLGLHTILIGKYLKIPIVITHHTHFPDYIHHIIRIGKLQEISKEAVKKLIKQVYNLANVTTAPTEKVVAELKEYGVKNVVYIANGIDPLGEKSPEKAEEFIKKYGIKKPYLLYLGRISKEKKLDILLKACKGLNLVVCGGGPDLERLKKEYPEFRYTGFLDEKELIGAYSGAEIFVSASDSETFGLTFVEAMHFGIPVVGVNSMGAAEVIEHEVSGLLAKPNDPKALREEILRLMENKELYNKIKKNSLKRAKEFSLDKNIERFNKLYEGIISTL